MIEYTTAIPVRDGAATIRYVVEAAAQQQPAPMRIIVCDDGSRDGSGSLAELAGAQVISHPRSFGLAAARNSLLAASETPFILYFDADAIPRQGCVAAMFEALSDERTAAAGGCGEEVGFATFADRWRARSTPQSHGRRPLDDDWMIMGLCCAFRVEALRQVGGFDTRFIRCGEDVDISLRLRQAGWRLAYRPDAIVDHARNDGVWAMLDQAYQHSRYAASALSLHHQPLTDLWRAACAGLGAALRRDLRALDAPSSLLTLANFGARAAGMIVGR